MCSASKREVSPTGVIMERGEPPKQDESVGVEQNWSILLELSAMDDLTGFKHAVEEGHHDVDESSLWYGRRIGCKKMGFVERTPLMIAAMFGSIDVLSYILQTACVDTNRACGSDGATALHCAAAGGSTRSDQAIKLLVDASADIKRVDAQGNRPCDVIAPSFDSPSKPMKKTLETMLKGFGDIEKVCVISDQEVDQREERKQEDILAPKVLNGGNSTEKKEYPVDPSLPDIKNGIYGTDDFRMFTFKVKPCSRAYTHDWTECPFVHPGENARRRDPRKYHYSCVPCPEFRKGSCIKGDACEYAHGIFECWLHPAQYRTRLCKDETNCMRRVCFFAHKREELRPLYASTGSAVPSPGSFSSGAASFDLGSMSPLALGSPALLMPSTSTPPMTPTSSSSLMAGAMWPNQLNLTPPTLQLPGSRLKTGLTAGDMDVEAEMLGLENQRRRQQLLEEIAGLSSPSSWKTNLDDLFGSLDSASVSRLQGLPLDAAATQLHSPTGMQARQNTNQQLLSGYSSGLACSPIRTSGQSSSPARASSFGVGSSRSPAAAAAWNPRSAAFAERSRSFIDRCAVNRLSGFSSSSASGAVMPSHLSDWCSSDGKLDWGVQGEELNKLRKSASFGIRGGVSSGVKASSPPLVPAAADEPDVSWVQSLVKDEKFTQLGFEEQRNQHNLNGRGSAVILPPWVEQLYMEQEQMVT
ncbi:hypothetical protein Nepgr_014061 [Nepenthes gracilis]|uniref:C3H1-type domain-containing protein n=1 Tax=Nepenthes gracilis TaxID=150966 RepID=A0AAD3SK00_NEPGR|nr:hypothetical protein Nepgr_014061 [Nepenthes gracilis]